VADSEAKERDAPPRVHLRRLSLINFRNYRVLSVDLEPGAIVLTGENGAGKTNLLEAVSLFSPGRGLRRASYGEIASDGTQDGFAVHAAVDGPQGDCEIGTGTIGQPGGPEGGRRVRINGATAKSADAMLEWMRVVWLTPAMDTLFTGPAGDRRRFLDRLVLAIDPAHGKRALDYEKAMRGRNRLLQEERSDGKWLDAIETEMAETGIAIAAARAELVTLLREMIERLPSDGPFPKSDIAIAGPIEEMAGQMAAVDLEEQLKKALREGRSRDRAAGRTLEGPHRSDLIVRHRPKDMPAALCSTGEQKALLVGLILAHARLTGELAGMAPILLLDEIAAHLDQQRRRALFAILEDLNCQAFMTGTERPLFSALEGKAQFLTVAGGTVVKTD
jgi:DNA replication and repair protein RecF